MDEHLKSSLTDTIKALPIVVISLVVMTVFYVATFRVVHGAWPF